MTALTRRGFGRLVAGSAALPALAAVPLAARAATPAPRPPASMTMQVGRFEVTFLSDGFADLPFGIFTGAPEAEIAAAAAARFAARPAGLRLGFTAWLVRDGSRTVLVDAGTAGLIGPTAGRLPEALAAHGVTPESVDAVIATHLHFDHIGGLVAGGRRVFPNAVVHAGRKDIAHFTDPARTARAPDLLKSSHAAAADLVRLYPGIEQLDGAATLLPGLETFDLAGHTPGSLGVRIADGGESLLLVSDLLFHPSLNPAHADRGIAFEEDPAAAEASRAAFFPRAAEEGALLAATHMPFPGLGRIVKDGGALAWLPADWEYGD